jgi:hypothetical protein
MCFKIFLTFHKETHKLEFVLDPLNTTSSTFIELYLGLYLYLEGCIEDYYFQPIRKKFMKRLVY